MGVKISKYSLDTLREFIYKKLDEHCGDNVFSRDDQIEALLCVAISLILDAGGELSDLDSFVDNSLDYMSDIMNKRYLN